MIDRSVDVVDIILILFAVFVDFAVNILYAVLQEFAVCEFSALVKWVVIDPLIINMDHLSD
jgi:hypothetical protein